jgi:hypothetical protein
VSELPTTHHSSVFRGVERECILSLQQKLEAETSERKYMSEKDPNGIGQHEPGAKLDSGKPRVWLCMAGFSRALMAVADVTTKGAAKYTPNGWISVPDGKERYMEGFARHALALGRGDVYDNGPGGTGCMHKAQMIWNLLASLELELREAEGYEK